MITLFTVECMYRIRVDVVVCTCLYYKFKSNGYTYFKLQDKKVMQSSVHTMDKNTTENLPS